MTTLIPILAFATVFLMVISAASLLGIWKHPIDERLSRIRQSGRTERVSYIVDDQDCGMMASLGEQMAPQDPAQRGLVKQRLAMAGYYSDQAYNNYWGVKIILILAMPLVVYGMLMLMHISFIKAVLPTVMAIGLGMFVPDLFLFIKKRKRHEQIFCGLPDALDLLVVCIEAGLGLDAAMQKVSEEFHLTNRVLSEELGLTCATVRMGQPRADALRDLGDRTGVQDLKSLMAVLIQADRFGTSMAQTLRVHSDDMRTRRRQRAEELAAKTTVKLLLPLVLFIFPSIFVVLGGPAVIKILDTLVKK